jgi:hypothetical protein
MAPRPSPSQRPHRRRHSPKTILLTPPNAPVPFSESCSYSPLKRLSSAPATGNNLRPQSYTYDGFGNMTAKYQATAKAGRQPWFRNRYQYQPSEPNLRLELKEKFTASKAQRFSVGF